jgi:predicted 3-demethylubiquinone-9 3-methyltransferase (glyoxalase superfamily)
MAVCDRCGSYSPEDFVLEEGNQPDVERLYRAVADNEPQREILQLIYDLFGRSCQLRPPVDELNLARKCGARSVSRG